MTLSDVRAIYTTLFHIARQKEKSRNPHFPGQRVARVADMRVAARAGMRCPNEFLSLDKSRALDRHSIYIYIYARRVERVDYTTGELNYAWPGLGAVERFYTTRLSFIVEPALLCAVGASVDFDR